MAITRTAVRARSRRDASAVAALLRRLRTRLAFDRGSAAVELAILWPAIIVGTFAAIQVASYFLARDVALNAAQEAATAQRGYNAPAGAGAARANDFLSK